MYLFIDSSDNNNQVGLLDKEGEWIDKVSWLSKQDQSKMLLLKIERLLRKNRQKIEKLNGIFAVSGPGSYTSLRVGLSTANAIAYSNNIPIIGLSKEKKLVGLKSKIQSSDERSFSAAILPKYNQAPHITKKKTK